MRRGDCRTQIFAEGSYMDGTLTWGWQCFGCNAEETGFATATTASEKAAEHAVEVTP